MYNIRVGYGCGIKATLLTASGEVCDLRRARYKGALLVLPNGSTIPCADVSVDDVTNAMYVRLLADRELTTTGKYGILFNVKMANGVMYSSPVIMFAEVSDNAEVEYKELNISFAVTVTYLPANVAYTGASPKISPNGTWLVFNDEINAYEDTGEPASYAGLRGDIQDLKDDISNKTTPIFITENTAVDWKTIGKNSKGELCVIGGDSEVSDYLAGYLSVNGYVKDEDVAATYATRKWVESKKYITFEDVPLTLKAYVNDAGYITLEAIAPYAKKADTLGGYGITNAYTKSEVDSAIFGALLPEKIMPSILIDDITIKRKADGTLYAEGGAGLDEEALQEYLDFNKYATIPQIEDKLQGYATISVVNELSDSVDDLSNDLKDFLEGSDTDSIINKWKELETFLSGLSESDNLAKILQGKANKADTLKGYGITDAYTKLESESKFIDFTSNQDVAGVKNFTNGLEINGFKIFYDSEKNALVVKGNLLVEKGLAWNSSIEGFEPKTITDAVMIDSSTLGRNENGEIYVKGSAGGGGSIAYPLSWSGYSSGVYDGSTPANIIIPRLLSQLENDVEYIKGVSSDMIVSALGYTPYDSTNPNGYITSSALSPYATTASVNSLLTDYLPKSGGTITGLIQAPMYSASQWMSAPFFTSSISSEGVNTIGVCRWGSFDEAGGMKIQFGADSSTKIEVVNREWSKGLFSINTSGNVKAAGNMAIGGTITATTFLPTGDVAIQFPEGEYIDKWGNIVLPSTASQWSVKQGDALLAVKSSSEVYVKGWLNFDRTYGPILTIRDGRYGQSAAMSVGWTDREGDMIKLHIPTAGSYDHHLMLSQYTGATLTMGLTVNGNCLATGEITQHSSLVLKDVVDTRFLTLQELVELKPYSFRWKDGRDDKLHAGAVADYVMPILPEVISTDKDDIHSMNYANAAWVVSTSLTPYVNNLVEEMKSLKVRVKYLENKLKES